MTDERRPGPPPLPKAEPADSDTPTEPPPPFASPYEAPLPDPARVPARLGRTLQPGVLNASDVAAEARQLKATVKIRKSMVPPAPSPTPSPASASSATASTRATPSSPTPAPSTPSTRTPTPSVSPPTRERIRHAQTDAAPRHSAAGASRAYSNDARTPVRGTARFSPAASAWSLPFALGSAAACPRRAAGQRPAAATHNADHGRGDSCAAQRTRERPEGAEAAAQGCAGGEPGSCGAGRTLGFALGGYGRSVHPFVSYAALAPERP